MERGTFTQKQDNAIKTKPTKNNLLKLRNRQKYISSYRDRIQLPSEITVIIAMLAL